MLLVDAEVVLIVMGKVKSSLTVQTFEFLDLINFVQMMYGSKKSVSTTSYFQLG